MELMIFFEFYIQSYETGWGDFVTAHFTDIKIVIEIIKLLVTSSYLNNFSKDPITT